MRDAKLEQVSHTRLVLPQLAATGVAAHEVRAQSGFSVVWGPVRIADAPAFLDAGAKATLEMRRVDFPMRERAKLVAWSCRSCGGVGPCSASAFRRGCGLAGVVAPKVLGPALVGLIVAALGVVAGAALVPLLLPWLPGRMFSLKGAVAGVLLIVPVLMVAAAQQPAPLWVRGALVFGVARASYVAMNFTGSSTFTSPSGVEWEMRRAIPLQLIGAVGGVALFVAGVALG